MEIFLEVRKPVNKYFEVEFKNRDQPAPIPQFTVVSQLFLSAAGFISSEQYNCLVPPFL